MLAGDVALGRRHFSRSCAARGGMARTNPETRTALNVLATYCPWSRRGASPKALRLEWLL